MKKLKQILSGRNIYSIISVAVLIALIVLGSVLLGPRLVNAAREPEQFGELVGSGGFKSYLVFIAIQFVQVVFAFIPGEFIEVGAGYVYGSFKGLVLCMIGVLLATCLIFSLTRLLGKKFTDIMIDSRNLKRLKFLQNEKKLELLFALLYFIPGTPKDLLTYFAGVTKIKFGTFIFISTLCRFPSIISSTMAGAALGEERYLRSVIIFAVTGAIATIGFLIYRLILKHHEKKSPKP